VNRSILIIICDFLLISILAIVEFKPQEPEPQPQSELQEPARSGAENDLVEVLRLSLEEEARNREALANTLAERETALSETAEELAERERALELTREEKARIEAERAALAAEQEQLSEAVAQARTRIDKVLAEKQTVEASLQSQAERNRALQEALAAREAALQDASMRIEELNRERAAIERDRQRLETDLKIVATERAMIEQNLVAARAEMETVRMEKERAEARASQLAEGVSRLAESSTELKQEIREAQPRSINDIFSTYERNRVQVSFDYSTAGLFGTRARSMTAQTILVEHNGQAYAVFEASNTPFDPWTLGDLRGVRATLRLGGRTLEFSEVGFLRQDPRLISVAIPGRFIEGSGIAPFRIEPEPTRFAQAVLIANRTGYYGEAPFKLQPGRRDAVEVQSRLFNRLFGEFSPSRGDFVFSLGGNFMGMMVDGSVFVLLMNPAAADPLPVGERFEEAVARRMAASLSSRLPSTSATSLGN